MESIEGSEDQEMNFEVGDVFSLNVFAKRIGFDDAGAKGFKSRLKHLSEKGYIEIQRSGFLSDSEYHHKLVVLREIPPIKIMNVDPRMFCTSCSKFVEGVELFFDEGSGCLAGKCPQCSSSVDRLINKEEARVARMLDWW